MAKLLTKIHLSLYWVVSEGKKSKRIVQKLCSNKTALFYHDIHCIYESFHLPDVVVLFFLFEDQFWGNEVLK